jgi:hypothetical protein
MRSIQWDRKPVSRPGIYSEIPMTDYHSATICDGASVSSTGLRKLWRTSPAHFYSGWECNPNRVPPTSSAVQMLGAAAHHLLLGEDHFKTLFIMQPANLEDEHGVLLPWQGNRKVCKQWKRDQIDAGRTILDADDFETIRHMARSLSVHPLVREAEILNGGIEQSGFVKEPTTGLWLRIRPDVMPSDGMFADLKTCASVCDFDLKMALRDYGYHQQAALVWQVCELLNIPFESFSLVFVEKTPPYCVRVVELTDDDLSRGRRQNEHAMVAIATCLEEGIWPGPGGSDAEPFSLPKADQEFIDSRLQQLEAA